MIPLCGGIQVKSNSGRPQGRPRTCCIEYLYVPWEDLRIPQEELEDVAGEKDVRLSGLLCFARCHCYPENGKTDDTAGSAITQRTQYGPTVLVKRLNMEDWIFSRGLGNIYRTNDIKL